MLSKMLMVAAAVSAVSAELPTKYFNKDLDCDDEAICVGGGLDANHLDCVQNAAKGIDGRCYIPKCYLNKGLAPPKGMRKCEGEGNAESIGKTAATSGTVGTVIRQNMNGWRDIPLSRMFDYPSSLLGRFGQIPSTYTEAGYTFEFDCPGRPGDKCDLFVFLYRCPPCQFQDGGNLAADLLANGWLPYTCDVRFKLNPFGHEHHTIVYHKQITSFQVEDITPSSTLELAWFAWSRATANCADYGSESQCRSELPSECEWKDGVCSRVLCPKQVVPPRPPSGGPRGNGDLITGKPKDPKGPWIPRCTTCIDDERHFMPTL